MLSLCCCDASMTIFFLCVSLHESASLFAICLSVAVILPVSFTRSSSLFLSSCVVYVFCEPHHHTTPGAHHHFPPEQPRGVPVLL